MRILTLPFSPALSEELLLCSENENSLGFESASLAQFYSNALQDARLEPLKKLLQWNERTSLHRWKGLEVWENELVGVHLDHVDTLDAWKCVGFLELPHSVKTLRVNRGDFCEWSHLPQLPVSIEKLVIVRTRLTQIPLSATKMFRTLQHHLYSLDLSRNELTTVQGLDLSACGSIRYVKLCNNRLESLDGLRLPSHTIEILDFESNQLTLKSFAHCRLDRSRVLELNLAHNDITGPLTSECTLTLPSDLLSLNLSFNPVRSMSTFRLPSTVNEVFLKDAELDDLEQLPRLPLSLRRINLEDNGLGCDNDHVDALTGDIITFNQNLRYNHWSRMELCRALTLHGRSDETFKTQFPILYFLQTQTAQTNVRETILQFWNPYEVYPWEELEDVEFGQY